jgi:hypothetical protein
VDEAYLNYNQGAMTEVNHLISSGHSNLEGNFLERHEQPMAESESMHLLCMQPDWPECY